MTAYFCLLFGARSCTKEERQRQQPEKNEKESSSGSNSKHYKTNAEALHQKLSIFHGGFILVCSVAS